MLFCFPENKETETMDSVIQFRGTIYENGYGLLASKVMRDTRLHRNSRLIYAYMCAFAGSNLHGERTAFPSIAIQCHELDMSEDTYYKYRKPLVDLGFITIEKRKGKGKFERNLYFIEAVPVEKPSERDSEPYPNSSGTENPSTEKSGTNINSSNINSFNTSNNINIDYIDDDKRTSSAVHNDESINLIISNLREATNGELTDRSFKSVVRKVVDKYNQGKVNSFRDYLVTALIRKIEELELRRIKDLGKQKIDQSKKQRTESRLKNLEIKDLPIYNWLED
jgi:hypothetical protein